MLSASWQRRWQRRWLLDTLYGSFAVYQAGAYNIAPNYALRDSVILDPATTIHVINDRARFIGDIRPTSDQLYAGSGIENIEGFGTAEVTVITPSGKQKIHLNEAAYVPGFHTNLVCNCRLNKKGVFWHNEQNYLYRRSGEKFVYCGYHHGQVTLEYNELKPNTPEDASFAAQLTEPLPNQKVNGKFWHSRLGHAGIGAVGRLPKEVTEAVVKDTTTVKCKTYTVSEAHKEISERIPTDEIADQSIMMESSASNIPEQNGSLTKRTLQEDLNKDTNEDNETLDETRVDIGGSRQVDFGNQDQATDQEELNPQDDDAIGLQASKDDPPPGLPTPAQSPEPQSNITTASTDQRPRFEYVPEKEARPRQEIRDDRDNSNTAEGR